LVLVDATCFWYVYVPEPKILVAFNAPEVVDDDCKTIVPLLVNVPLISKEPDGSIVRVTPLFTTTSDKDKSVVML
jgi:hypothetical protein